jgi:hypothetical protein
VDEKGGRKKGMRGRNCKGFWPERGGEKWRDGKMREGSDEWRGMWRV